MAPCQRKCSSTQPNRSTSGRLRSASIACMVHLSVSQIWTYELRRVGLGKNSLNHQGHEGHKEFHFSRRHNLPSFVSMVLFVVKTQSFLFSSASSNRRISARSAFEAFLAE